MLRSEQVPTLSLLTPEDLRQADKTGGFDLDSNILQLRPNAVHLVQLLKSIDRPDITSGLFVRLLDAYREAKSYQENDPMRSVLPS